MGFSHQRVRDRWRTSKDNELGCFWEARADHHKWVQQARVGWGTHEKWEAASQTIMGIGHHWNEFGFYSKLNGKLLNDLVLNQGLLWREEWFYFSWHVKRGKKGTVWSGRWGSSWEDSTWMPTIHSQIYSLHPSLSCCLLLEPGL